MIDKKNIGYDSNALLNNIIVYVKSSYLKRTLKPYASKKLPKINFIIY